MNLVLGAIYGYDWEKVKHFVISLRKHYDGHIAFIVHNDIINDSYFIEQLDKYNVSLFNFNERLNSNHDIINLRFQLYSEIINQYDVEEVFITDVRDVIFQSDPFSFKMETDLEFYYEPSLFRDCNCNSWWIKTMCGEHIYQEMADKYIVCAGTMRGTKNGILNYLVQLNQELMSMRHPDGSLAGGSDQVAHNRLIHTNRVESVTVVHNGYGTVSTLEHQKTFDFDEQGRYINVDGTPTPVIHQWDRKSHIIDKFEKIALE